MPRPLKIGLDYFPLDVNMDDSIELVEAEHGLEGFAVLIKLWQKIFSESYYIDWKKDNIMLFARKINSAETLVSSVVSTCIERGIFDKYLFDTYSVLTSKAIQKRYLIACKQAKRANIPFHIELLLVSPELTSIITEETSINPEVSTQRKEKGKREERERKVKESIGESPEDSTPLVVVPGDKELNIFQEYEKAGYGTISSHLMEELQELEKEYSTVWVVDALKLGAEQGKCKVSYVKGILKNWKADGRDAKKPTTYYKSKEVKTDFTERVYDHKKLEEQLLRRDWGEEGLG